MKTFAYCAVAVIATAMVLTAGDNSAQDAADYAATHPAVTNCKAAR